jgi:aconitate hydratase
LISFRAIPLIISTAS